MVLSRMRFQAADYCQPHSNDKVDKKKKLKHTDRLT